MSMPKYRYALVSWTKGPDKDAVSIVPTNWIIDFNPTDTSRTYLVECRMANTKKPVNGWPVEHALVMQLAEKESTLKSAERELFKMETPKDNKRPRKPKRLFEDQDETGDTNCQITTKKKPKLAAQIQAEEEILFEDSKLEKEIRSPGESSSSENVGRITDLQNQVKALQKENARLCNMVVKEIPSLLVDVRKMVTLSNPTKVLEAESDGETVIHCKPSEVKLGNHGNITVSAHCWETAKAQNTASGMARVLLMGLFSVDVLLKSNLTGGINKINPTAERRQALDGEKLQALLDAVINHYPGAKMSDLRKTINTRICELCFQTKRKQTLS